MERNPATIRPGLALHPKAPWVAAPGLVVHPDQVIEPAAEDPAPSEGQGEVAIVSRTETPDRTFLTTIAKYAQIAAVATLAVAALSILVVLAVNVYVGLASLPTPSPDTPNGIVPQRAGLLVWTQGLGACLALVLYFEGEQLRALVRRIGHAARGRWSPSREEYSGQ